MLYETCRASALIVVDVLAGIAIVQNVSMANFAARTASSVGEVTDR